MNILVSCLNGYRVLVSKVASLSLRISSASSEYLAHAIRNHEHLHCFTNLTHKHIKIFGASVSPSPNLQVTYSDSLNLRCSGVCTFSHGKAYVLGVDEGIFAVLEGLFGLDNIIYE